MGKQSIGGATQRQDRLLIGKPCTSGSPKTVQTRLDRIEDGDAGMRTGLQV